MKLLAVLVALMFISGEQATAKDLPVSLVHKGHKKDIHFLQPVFPVQLGVVQEKGSPAQERDFFQCEPKARKRKIVIDGNEAELVEMILECKDGVVFVVKGLEFESTK